MCVLLESQWGLDLSNSDLNDNELLKKNGIKSKRNLFCLSQQAVQVNRVPICGIFRINNNFNCPFYFG